MVYTASHRATYQKEWQYSFPEHTSSRWFIALREPPELSWSRDVECTAELLTSEGWKLFERRQDGSPENRAMLIIDHSHNDAKLKNGFTIRTSFTATIYHQELRKGKGIKPIVIGDAKTATFLRETETFDFSDPLVKKWMDQNSMWKTDRETERDFVIRVYRHLRRTIPYNTADGGRWICSQILKTGFGECCRHAVVGTSILRANGIPARTVCGVWAIDANSKGGHCWGEFYLKNVGWIPYDTTLDSQNKTADQYFGSKKGEILAGMVDFDWEIDAGTLGKHTVFAIDYTPAFWSEGKGDLTGPSPVMREAIQPATTKGRRTKR
jgi:transglutaminase-like putative cysteine protease